MDRVALRNRLNDRGVTLIEMIIALVLLLIVSLAMMQTGNLAIQTNLANALRDEAVNVAEARMNELRNELLTSTATSTLLTQTAGLVSDSTTTRSFRAASFQYTLSRQVSDIGTDAKQVTLNVTWTHQGASHSHSITTILRRQS